MIGFNGIEIFNAEIKVTSAAYITHPKIPFPDI